MRRPRPDKYEFEVQEALDGYCYANGVAADGVSVDRRLGSQLLHPPLGPERPPDKDGDVVLNDSGAEYGYYATDITRTYPVNGRFSPEQRAIYEIVLAAQKAALAVVRPGATHRRRRDKAAGGFRPRVSCKLGLLSGDPAEIVKKLRAPEASRSTAISHWVGLDVHDAGSYRGGAAVPACSSPAWSSRSSPGSTFPRTLPGVDPKWWNIGVRIEDTVLVTNDGYECLSCAAPARGRRRGEGGPGGPVGEIRPTARLTSGRPRLGGLGTRMRTVSSPTRQSDGSLQHAVAVDLRLPPDSSRATGSRRRARARRARCRCRGARRGPG